MPETVFPYSFVLSITNRWPVPAQALINNDSDIVKNIDFLIIVLQINKTGRNIMARAKWSIEDAISNCANKKQETRNKKTNSPACLRVMLEETWALQHSLTPYKLLLPSLSL